MKSNIRSRKILFDSIKRPPSQFILRSHKKEEDQQYKIELQHQTPNALHSDQRMKNTTDLNMKEIKEETEFLQQTPQFLQARDRKVIVKYDFTQKKFSLDHQKKKLNQWLGEMHFKVVSSSFNLYLSEDLTFQQVKVHCCENLLLNILNFLESLTENYENSEYISRYEREHQSYLEMTAILKHINQVLNKNLAYLQIKYPLTKDSKPNKTLQSLITKINNLGNDEHDMVMKSKVEFKFKDEGNYTAEIMKFINFLITEQSQHCGIKGNNKKQLTYFEYFYETMERIFTSIYTPDYDTNQKENENEKLKENKKEKEDSVLNNEFLEIKTKQQKQYKQKVMKYTHYLIGRKISSNTQVYSDKQMQTQIFDVKNSSILRILTKWTEQLEKKILNAEEQILKRPFRFKRNKQAEFSKLNANQKNDLYQQANRKAKEVNSFNEQLKENYNQIETMLSSHLHQASEYDHIPMNEYKVGFFCSKIQAAASSTLLSYLNKIIHILLLIPQQLKKMHVHDEQYIQNININLVTFKISDLFRCKIKSREAEIIRIFKQIKLISDKGDPFKIVRIKDRLSQGTRDIMVNILFKGIFLCQIQLAIEEYVETKQQLYDSFSHFLYEMHRSRLGPIMESACTWAQFDQRVKIFRQINHNSGRLIQSNIQHRCDRQLFVTNQYPFVCTLCEKFYSNQVGLIGHKKCLECKTYYECSVCLYYKMNEKQISSLLGMQQLLGIFKQDFRLWNYEEEQQKNRKFPLFGLIISKKMKKLEVIFFQTIIFKYDAYIIHLKFNEKAKEEEEDQTELVIIEKILGNSEKQIRSIAEKYIIYEWKEQRYINRTFLPSSMRDMMKEEKQGKEKINRQKKEQKERKKLILQQKQQARFAELWGVKGEDKQAKIKKQQKTVSKEKQNKKTEKHNGATKFNEKIFKMNEFVVVRVIEKVVDNNPEICVLGIFLKEYTIRNKLRKMNNQSILQKLISRKIQVLFMEDEFIHDEINDTGSLNEIQMQELRETFEGISEVYFDNNYIENLLFLQLISNLKVAHFSNNNISNLSPLQNLKQLTELILQNNNISDLSGLKNKRQLVELNLNRNKLEELTFFSTIEEGQLGKLKILYANDNSIESMDGIEKLKSLVKLDLSFNKIKEISQIRTLLSLEELDLSVNQITKMKGISNFKNVKKLFLNNNFIKIISKEMAELNKLTILNLASNKIKIIDNLNNPEIAKTLKVLKLSDNKIQKMEKLDNLEALQYLNLSYNEIQIIHSYLDLGKLRILDLSYNCIQGVDLEQADVEKYLSQLQTLNLTSNIVNNTDTNRLNLAYLSKRFKNISVTFKKQL